MITLIGFRATVIGFGLCGINDIHEVTIKTEPTQIKQWIKESKNEVVLIDNETYKKVKGVKTKKMVIRIPSRFEEGDEDDLNSLIRDTVGVAIKN